MENSVNKEIQEITLSISILNEEILNINDIAEKSEMYIDKKDFQHSNIYEANENDGIKQQLFYKEIINRKIIKLEKLQKELNALLRKNDFHKANIVY